MDHRGAVGGLWDEIGKRQFDFLVERGLKPRHHFLDVACGSLRGGVHFIGYLEAGHYYGIDLDQSLLDAGRDIELPRYGLAEKPITLRQMSAFEFELLDRTFDYALAQSLFTHLYINQIARCLLKVQEVLLPGGVFFATFIENERGKNSLAPVVREVDGRIHRTNYDSDPFHYSYDVFEFLCRDTQLRAEYVGDWGHPRHQKMLKFTRVESD